MTTPLRGVAFEASEGCRVIARSTVSYEDGGEARVLEAISTATDISSLSDELESAPSSWAERYHLSKSRANALRPFKLRKDMRVLDVGGGCGAIARYLGETCGHVDVLEPMTARAVAARARTRDLANVEVFVGGLDAVPQEPAYDLITVIGVLEYVGGGSRSDEPYCDFLRHLKLLLRPGGRIVLAIENRLGVKYLAGAPEDHSGRPFDGLEGYRSGGPARTFSRVELEQLVLDVGLSADFYHAFPDYKMTRAVFSESIFEPGSEQALAWRLPNFPSPDWNQPREPWVDEESLWRGLVQSGVGRHFSNSFIVVASQSDASSAGLWNPDEMAVFYTTGRRAQFATETRVRHETGGVYFRRRLLAGDAKEVESGDVTLRIEDSAFIRGQPLLEVLADADEIETGEWLQRWRDLVESGAVADQTPIDLVPGNILVDQSGALHAVDQEWWRRGGGEKDILPRGVIWLAHHLTKLTPPDRWSGETVADLAVHIGAVTGLDPSGEWLPDALQREAEFQVLVHDCEVSSPAFGEAVEEKLRDWRTIMDQRVADGSLGPWRGVRGVLSDTMQLLDLERCHLQAVEHEVNTLETRLEELALYVYALEAKIREITGSAGFRALERLRKVVRWAAPDSSRRRMALGVSAAVARGVRRGGLLWLGRKAVRVRDWHGYLRTPIGSPTLAPCDRNEEYQKWLTKNAITDVSAVIMRGEALSISPRPLISIVTPVYNPDVEWITDAIESVKAQLYDNWELCLADDCSTTEGVREVLERYSRDDERIRVRFLEKNLGIGGASNAAFEMAQGEFVGLLDHDDILKPEALYEVARYINDRPDVDFIYSDEDKLDLDGRLMDPFFKPDWSPETLLSMNYVTHFAVYRKTLLDRIGGFRTDYDGSQDYDLVLRATEQTREIGHIKRPIYTWRMVPGSAAASIDAKPYAYEAARRAIDDALRRRGVAGHSEHGSFTGSYRIRYDVDPATKVSIIIPTRDRLDLLRRCINSIRRKSTFKSYDITIVDNDSEQPATLQYLNDFAGKVARFPGAFNFSKIVNFGATQADGDYLLFLNNDTEILTEDWIEAMLEEAQKPGIGPVGACLLFPDGRAQHHGIVIRMAGPAANVDCGDYFGLGRVVRNVSAVTAACMMVSRKVFEELGGFDEEMAVAYNDVDFCLRALDRGYRVVYTPFAQLRHHESATRGTLSPAENASLFERRWLEERDFVDPYYNPNLDLRRPYCIDV